MMIIAQSVQILMAFAQHVYDLMTFAQHVHILMTFAQHVYITHKSERFISVEDYPACKCVLWYR